RATSEPPAGGGGATTVSALRRSILVHLRRSGPSSPDAIAAALGASRSGVVQQLRALDGAGLVTRTAVRHGVGRPRHLYDVTADAQTLFP
ncbi:MarR family transcriptional regulator, partial [Salmonella enterica subsp. enterica serovar Minnesota]|uniref:helix-turn-helix domain-containing protein n=1 Tax=Salmonella enterica TaxID=28901 RepID=UPI003D2C2DB1